jgi:hypothetical protein
MGNGARPESFVHRPSFPLCNPVISAAQNKVAKLSRSIIEPAMAVRNPGKPHIE